MDTDLKLGFVGAGAMARALIAGVIRTGLYEPRQIAVNNRHDLEKLHGLQQEFGIRAAAGKADLHGAEVLVLAVKPKDMAQGLEELAPHLRDGQLLVTVAAGIRTSFIEKRCGRPLAVVRAMPNLPSAVQAAATALAPGRYCQPQHLAVAEQLFRAVGETVTVAEDQLDAVTGLSGSGPAYVYYMIEGLEQAGATLGLEPEVARKLAVQTVFGAAKLLLQSGESPESLRQRVSSPGGTTVAALESLSSRGWNQALQQAVLRATQRARELGMA